MPGPVLQILDMSYHDLLNSLKDIKMQVFLPYFVRKAKGYYNAQLLDYGGGDTDRRQKASLLVQVAKNPTTLSYLRIFHSLSITTLNTSIC